MKPMEIKDAEDLDLFRMQLDLKNDEKIENVLYFDLV